MTDAPPPDLHVDEALAARLVAAQHPDLAGARAARRERVGQRDVPPRRPVPRCGCRGARSRSGSCATSSGGCPSSRRACPCAVPAPVRNGRPAPELGYDVPWSILPWFDGRERARVRSRSTRGVAVNALAAFVAELARCLRRRMRRRTRSAACRSLHRDEAVRGAPRGGRVPEAAALRGSGSARSRHPRGPGRRCGCTATCTRRTCCSRRRAALAAVIDFGDITAGDPATDLATAWLTFDPRVAPRLPRRARGTRAASTRPPGTAPAGGRSLIASAVVEVAARRASFGSVASYVLEQAAARLTRPRSSSTGAAAGDAPSHGCRGMRLRRPPPPREARVMHDAERARARSRAAPRGDRSRSTGRAGTSRCCARCSTRCAARRTRWCRAEPGVVAVERGRRLRRRTRRPARTPRRRALRGRRRGVRARVLHRTHGTVELEAAAARSHGTPSS